MFCNTNFDNPFLICKKSLNHFIKWDLIDNKNVENIAVYTFGGQLLKSYFDLRNNTQTIPFSDYPTGYFLVILTYNGGEQKTLNIVKQ